MSVLRQLADYPVGHAHAVKVTSTHLISIDRVKKATLTTKLRPEELISCQGLAVFYRVRFGFGQGGSVEEFFPDLDALPPTFLQPDYGWTLILDEFIDLARK